MITKAIFRFTRRSNLWFVDVFPFTKLEIAEYVLKYHAHSNAFVAIDHSSHDDGFHPPKRVQLGCQATTSHKIGLISADSWRKVFNRCEAMCLVDLKLCILRESCDVNNVSMRLVERLFESPDPSASYWRYSSRWIYQHDEELTYFDCRPNVLAMRRLVHSILLIGYPETPMRTASVLCDLLMKQKDREEGLSVEWNRQRYSTEVVNWYEFNSKHTAEFGPD